MSAIPANPLSALVAAEQALCAALDAQTDALGDVAGGRTEAALARLAEAALSAQGRLTAAAGEARQTILSLCALARSLAGEIVADVTAAVAAMTPVPSPAPEPVPELLGVPAAGEAAIDQVVAAIPDQEIANEVKEVLNETPLPSIAPGAVLVAPDGDVTVTHRQSVDLSNTSIDPPHVQVHPGATAGAGDWSPRPAPAPIPQPSANGRAKPHKTKRHPARVAS